MPDQKMKRFIVSLLLIFMATQLPVMAATQSLRSGGYFCGTDGTCQWFKPGDPDWLFHRFTYAMGYADCPTDISTWRTKSPNCRLTLYTTGTDIPAYKKYDSNSYLFGKKSTYIRDRMVELGDIEEHTYMHFYDDTEIRHYNGSGYDTVLIPGTYSMTITNADSASRAINSYTNYLFFSGNTYEGEVRLSPNFTNENLRLAYKEYITQIFNEVGDTDHWPGKTGYWDGAYFDNYSPYAMMGGNLVSGGHIVETGTDPASLLLFATDEYRDWGWEWMKVFGREVRDTLQMADQWAVDNKKKILAYNVGLSHWDDYLDPALSGADALNVEFGFDPVYSNNNSYFRLENIHSRDSIAVLNGVTYFWTSRPRTSYGNGSTSKRQAIYNNLCFYYVARTDSTWIFMRPEPGNAYGVFYNPGFDTLAWVPAMEYDLGLPLSHYQLATSGTSPDESGATYKIWVRDYQYGKVYMRPRDGFDAKWGDTSTPIEVDLGGSYRQIQTDGSLGPVVTTISLVGAAGAIMIPSGGGDCSNPPTIPLPSTPSDGATIPTTTPELCVSNSSSPGCSQPIRYHFQVAAIATFTVIVAENSSVSEGTTVTCWQVPTALDPGQTYYWRVRASNGTAVSTWSTVRNFVVPNSPPTVPILSSPAAGDSVTTRRPTLVIINATDPEGANLTYHFQVSLSSGFGSLATENNSVGEEPANTAWQVDVDLQYGLTYFWRVRAHDGVDYSNWSAVSSFYVHQSGANHPPTVPTLHSPPDGGETTELTPTLTINNSSDEDGDALTYQFEIRDSTFGSQIAISGMIPSGNTTTAWTVTVTLAVENSYKWRVRAYDSQDWSDWMTVAVFTVEELANQWPTHPVPISPLNGDTVVGSFAALAIQNATDPDGDLLTYDFRVFSDPGLTKQIEIGCFIPQGDPITVYYTTTTLSDEHMYYWHARANDGTVWTNWFTAQHFWHVDNLVLDIMDTPRPIYPDDGASIWQAQPTLRARCAAEDESVLFLFEMSTDETFLDLVA
ncbi:MAG: hypothetical protein KAT58_00015, partial [candidate division Zixibacteria bacterium]|nr:hypothetical protein [candidate division Zixibacteria bacterium]